MPVQVFRLPDFRETYDPTAQRTLVRQLELWLSSLGSEINRLQMVGGDPVVGDYAPLVHQHSLGDIPDLATTYATKAEVAALTWNSLSDVAVTTAPGLYAVRYTGAQYVLEALPPGGGLVAVYTRFFDGSQYANASGADTFRFRSADNKLSVHVFENDPSFGDNLRLTINQQNIDHNELANFEAIRHIDHSAVVLTAGTGLTGGGDISASRTFDLDDTAVTPASYGTASEVAQFTVDQQGRLTLAANVAIAIDTAAVVSGEFADARIAAGNVTQHQAALSIAWGQLTSVPATFPPEAHSHGLGDLTGFGAAGGYIRSDGAAWERVSGLAWADLTGVPSEFPPEAHGHAISNISGLQAELDSKEPGLGNPAADGYALVSTMAGTRSWVAMSGGAGTLGGLTDVTLTAPAAGNFLRYDGADWLNTALGAADIPALDAAKIETGTFSIDRIPDVPWSKLTSIPDFASRWPAWGEVTGKPLLFPPEAHQHVKADITDFAHTHLWADITNPPDFATRWPAWGEVTGKPLVFPPDVHGHVWGDLSGLPDFATRWPTWGEVTSKPLTFPPDPHIHDDRYYTESEVDDFLLNYNPVENGFVSRDDNTISLNEGTRTFTIAPTGASFEFWATGARFVKSAPENVVIPDVEGIHFIYYDGTGTLIETGVFNLDIIVTFCFVTAIYWDATNKVAVILGDERHGRQMDAATHLWAHASFGAMYGNGFAPGNLSMDGNGNLAAHAQLSLSGGRFRDEDITHVIADGLPQELEPILQAPILYRAGANGDWRKIAATNFPVTTAGGGRAAYNLFSSGVWSLAEASNNNHVLIHLFATNDTRHPIVSIVGQGQYNSLGAARSAALQELNELQFGGLGTLLLEFIPIATFICQTANSMSNAVKVAFRTTEEGDDYVDWREQRGVSGSGASASDHGSLSGLSNDDHLQYFNELRGDARYSQLGHGHVIADVSGLQTALDGKEPSLGVPAVNGYVLASTTAGFRSWVEMTGGGGGSASPIEYSEGDAATIYNSLVRLAECGNAQTIYEIGAADLEQGAAA